MRNTMSLTLSQQILSGMLLLVTMDAQKSNLICELKFEPIITYHMWFIMKMLWNIVDVALF